MKKFTFTLMVLISVLSLTACAPKVNREVGQLNLAYKSEGSTELKPNLPIAIVDPQFKDVDSNHNPGKRIYGFRSPNFNKKFFDEYKQQISRAFSNSFQEMLTEKGFNLLGPYMTFDDMTYGDKKKGYLALVPSFNVTILKKPEDVSTAFFTGITTETGLIQVSGELKIDFVEPLTNEKILSRRINLSDLNIEQSYILQQKTKKGFTILGEIASAFSTCQDSTDKALTDALNDFYLNSVVKIDKFVSTEEIVSYRNQVDGLKNLKRF